MLVQRVERHIIRSDLNLDSLCFKAENLYNRANYAVRQTFISTSKKKEAGLREHADWPG